MLMRQHEQLDAISHQRASQPQQDLAFDSSGPSQRKNSVASKGIRANDAVMDDAPMARYPMDDIRERANCQLHQSTKNIPIKVTVGFALPSEPGACLHGGQISAGYARVEVDKVMKGCETLELDIPAGEGDTTLGEVTHGIIL
jgi:hypothetical protein